MKRILTILLAFIAFTASAQYVPGQKNYGNYNVYGSQWINGDLKLQRCIRSASDTLLIFARSTGELDTVNWSTLRSGGGGSGTSFWDSTSSVLHPADTANAVAIGTNAVASGTMLRVNNGSVLFDGYTGTTPASGAGTRMMWIPSKGAFRAGGVSGTQWDDANIGLYSSAFGLDCKASGYASHAEGYRATASGDYSHAAGLGTTASGDYSHAAGLGTTASGYASHAEGYSTTASGESSHAEGLFTTASGYSSHAEGDITTASENFSHAEGDITTASGNSSHAEGAETTASGNSSHAEGAETTASGNYSHAEGGNTTAIGYASHAEGYRATASGDYSHAGGSYTTAIGYASHAEGYRATASGDYSHAAGYSTAANSYILFASGRYNDTTLSTDKFSWVNTDPLFQIGNGTDGGANSNDALRILKNGTAYIGDASSTTDPILTVSTTDSTTSIIGTVSATSLASGSSDITVVEVDSTGVMDTIGTQDINTITFTMLSATRINAGIIYTDTAVIANARIYADAVTLADDSTITLPAGAYGGGSIKAFNAGTIDEYITDFSFNSDGSVLLIQNSTDVDDADTDGKLCVFDSGAETTIKNRLGGSRKLVINITYYK